MSRVLPILIGGALFIGAFIAAQAFFVVGRPQTPQQQQAQLEKEVASVKTTLPKDIGAAVTWYDVEAQWQTIVYKYKIHAPRDVVVAKKKELEAQVKGSMMLGAAMFLMPKDVKMKYELYDDSGSFIYTLDLD